MPAKLDRCVKKLKQKGYEENSAWAICVTSTGWKRGKGGKWVKTKNKKRR